MSKLGESSSGVFLAPAPARSTLGPARVRSALASQGGRALQTERTAPPATPSHPLSPNCSDRHLQRVSHPCDMPEFATHNFARKLCVGLGSWLSYEFQCHRSSLFSERYLAPAIGQLLGAYFGTTVHSEFEHPILSSLAHGPGRRPTLDFAVLDPYPSPIVVVESKWAGSASCTADAIVWDLLRLEMVAAKFGARAYFVLAGKRKDLQRLFASAAFQCTEKSNGKSRPVLNTHSNSRRALRLDAPSPARARVFRRALQGCEGIHIPVKFHVERTAPFPLTCANFEYQAYAWSVFPSKDRTTFDAGLHGLYRTSSPQPNS